MGRAPRAANHQSQARGITKADVRAKKMIVLIQLKLRFIAAIGVFHEKKLWCTNRGVPVLFYLNNADVGLCNVPPPL